MPSAQLRELLLQSLEHERGGVLIYQTALECVINEDLRREWEKYLEQTEEHVRVLTELCSTFDLDPNRDTPGPIVIATAFERAAGDRQQRVVVVGNGSFLSNAFIGNGGNRDLGINLVNWLSGDDNLITLQPRGTADSNINIDQTILYLIAIGFLIVVPLAFMITGAVIWWRRRRI